LIHRFVVFFGNLIHAVLHHLMDLIDLRFRSSVNVKLMM
jgi:hypothetical protein